jgi:hypothetical protein
MATQPTGSDHPRTSVNITSEHYIRKIENTMVQLMLAISVEHSISKEEAVIITRDILQNKINALIQKHQQTAIDKLKEETISRLKNGNDSYARMVYDIMKLGGLV